MTYLLDTNVLSELSRQVPDQDVLDWLEAADLVDLHTSAIVIGEIRFGIDRMPDGRRKSQLARWYQFEMPGIIRGGILPVDRNVAERYGQIRAQQMRQGHPRGELDTWIVATAAVSGLAVVTRNFRDFQHLGVEVINPWDVDGVKDMPGTEHY